MGPIRQTTDELSRIASFFDAAPQAMIAVCGQGRIVLVNRRAEEMFGYSRAELLGQDLEILVPERYRAAHRIHVQDYFCAPRIRTISAGMELTARRKNGSEFVVEIGLGYIETGGGLLALGLVSDVTELKRATGELAQINAELRRSNAELDQFAFIASHDLQEPLRMITSYLNLLERRCGAQLGAEGLEFLRYAVDGAVRMKALIGDLLSISRLGTQPLRLAAVPAEAALHDALTNLRAAIEESGAAIESAPLPEILADRGLLTRVFQNLVGNAVKFRGDRQPRVQVSASRNRAEWIFTVSDNGIGIEPKDAERVFRIFERLHETEEYEGAGIGLAVCRKIVERHGGRIWLGAPGEGDPGGTVFHFSIPAGDAG